ncbi:Regulator of chromosome condensation [Geodia barretti]|nr:Regulator of chromosome condensation [Geodia barretti]
MGQGDTGQLGLGEDMVERKKPHPVGGALEGLRVCQVECGGMHTVALTGEGKVFTWGCNDEGALGRPTNSEAEAFTPGLVDRLKGVKIVQVSAGDSHTAALSEAGTVYGWGIFRDNNGAFGFLPPPSPPTPSPSPHIIYSAPNKALKITSGCDHMAIVTEHGDIYTVGRAEQGQLGRIAECFSSRGGRKGISLLLKPDVVRVRVKRKADKPKFTDAFCGSYQTFAVTEKGEVYAWGMNNYGQLCTGDKVDSFQPILLKDGWIGGRGQGRVLGVAKKFGISSGQHHTVVCCGGDVLTCGRKEYGRLGLGEESEEPGVPALVESLKGVKVASVEAGGSCSFVVTETGEVYSWGMGTNLQLGMSDDEDVWTPQKVTGKKIENRKVLSVSVGGQHTVLLVSGDGE